MHLAEALNMLYTVDFYRKYTEYCTIVHKTANAVLCHLLYMGTLWLPQFVARKLEVNRVDKLCH